MEEMEAKAQRFAAEQLVTSLQHAQADHAQAEYKQLEAAEAGELAGMLLLELEGTKETVESFFEKQALREKVDVASADRRRWRAKQSLAASRVSSCVEELVP